MNITAEHPGEDREQDTCDLDDLFHRAWLEAWRWPQPFDYMVALRDAGVALDQIDGIGVADIGISNGRWVERFRGERAYILPVLDDADEIVDLVAFRLKTPKSFWSFAGRVRMLGEENRERASYFGEPLMVHECPLDWLKAGRTGVVIVDWQDFWPFTLAGIPALQCVSDDFGRRLMSRMQRPFAIPQIQVAL